MLSEKGRKPIVCVSACLLGDNVRYDGGNKYDPVVASVLAEKFKLQPVCPEVESGLSVPREKMSLVETDGEIRLIGNKSGKEYTEALANYSCKKAESLKNICGFVLKGKSPSCGLSDAKIMNGNEKVVRTGHGIFAKELEKLKVPLISASALLEPPVMGEFIADVSSCFNRK